MFPNVGKYVMATFGLILLYLVLSRARDFNSTINAIGNVTLKGIGVLQGRSSNDIIGVNAITG